eukprot:TRINITY_DN5276_c0_g2_i1.p1 TRINITY_DN5276_c0_g2~~TRINITY_DN5276_c0_g2_i1.p1  ORF type:complete len:141 (+),score=24.32 TRINITY_DN5276_c0_g2_i1:67-489(+)
MNCFGSLGSSKQDTDEEKSLKATKFGKFEDIMTDKELCAQFHDLLKRELSEENLTFYIDTTRFGKKNFEDEKELEVEAKRICDKYLGLGSQDLVLNLSPSKIKQVARIMQQSPIPQDIFEEARIDIEMILKSKFLVFESL